MALSKKIQVSVDLPLEDAPQTDVQRLEAALALSGVTPVKFSLQALRQMYPAIRNGQVEVVANNHGDHFNIVSVSSSDAQTSPLYGLAVDYGSTTIVMQLVDVSTKQVVAELTEANGQIQYGTDILTRITYCIANASGKEELQKATAETFNTLLTKIEEKLGEKLTPANCPLMIISGNTTMQHFLLGLDAWTVFSAPYAPVTLQPGFQNPSELGIHFSGEIFFIPGCSNYVGGDIMSGLLTLDFYHSDETSLFFDVGTNGEMVVGNKDWLMAGAGAAGPALEGYISKFGCRAQSGAIDTVSITNNELHYTTIDNEAPLGICGSGIIDLVAQLRLAGWISIDGTFNPSASDSISWLEETQEYAVVYADASQSAQGVNLTFSQTDLHQYLETKAAAHTMLDCMLDATGLCEDDLRKLYLTGSFCAHANLESAITIGMFPDLERDRYVGMRNSSLDGARTLLLDENKLEEIDYILDKIYCIQFASMPDFTIRMHAAKFIPHTNMSQYPYVAQQLQERGLS